MRKRNDRLRISNIFALIVVIIMGVSMALTYLLVYLLLRFQFSPLTGAITSSSFVAVSSVIMGTLIVTYVSRKILSPIFKINDAARNVAKGDFSVRLEEKSIAKEIEEIASSFNIMVKELSNTETLRNDFVGNVSHEFKTPLSAIEGYATLLQDDTLSPEEQKRYIDHILENTGRLTNLTQNILSLSRLENQDIILQREAFPLDEQIRRVLLGYESLWESKNLTIDLNLDSITYFGNKSLLAQVWSNLIDNAIKFSNDYGVLYIDCRIDAETIVVTVRDNGIGMPKEAIAHAFDKFYQGERSHTVKGNGLGLALVKRIVTLCGGTVSLESEEGKGTAVTVVLNYSALN